MEIIKTICDVCDEETRNGKIDIQVIFTTEQNEGLLCKPYLCNEKLNLCNKCLNNALYNGNYIYAKGAMGQNTYFFRKIESRESNVKD